MNTPRFGACIEDWKKLREFGLVPDLLPVISNTGAIISPSSKIQSIGKTPSLYNANRHVIGIPQWTQRISTGKDVETWSSEPDYGICLQTRNVRALDIDIDDHDTAAKVRDCIFSQLGLVPLRYRNNSGKCLVGFTLSGDYTKRILKTSNGAIEFLATGQQFVAYGTHPSGARYEWKNLESGFPVIEAEIFENIWKELIERFAVIPEIRAGNTSRKQGEDLGLDDPIVDKLGVLEWGSDKQAFITCPFEANHSSDTGIGQCCYFPAGTNGYERGHFHCFHASCTDKTDGDFLDALGLRDDMFQDCGPQDEASPSKNPPKKFTVIPAGTFAEFSPSRWRVKNVLPEVGLAMVYGPSGAGKTFWMLDIVTAVTRGVTWQGHKVRQGRVVYIAAEGALGLRKRLKAYAIHHQVDLSKLPLGLVEDSPNFLDGNDIKPLLEQIQAAGGADIVVVDTLAQVTPGADENSGADMGAVFKRCQQIQQTLGCLVILVHHTGKDISKGARGWSGMKAALDTEIFVAKINGVSTAQITKQKDGENGRTYPFRLAQVALGVDDDEEVITSCVVEAAEYNKAQPPPKGKWQTAVYEAVSDLMGNMGTRCSVEEVIALAVTMRPQEIIQGKRDSRPDCAKRALIQLEKDGYFEINDGYVGFPQIRNTPQNDVCETKSTPSPAPQTPQQSMTAELRSNEDNPNEE